MPSAIPICRGCRKTPRELPEYAHLAADLRLDPDSIVRTNEPTYDPKTGFFWCDPCFVADGMKAEWSQ